MNLEKVCYEYAYESEYFSCKNLCVSFLKSLSFLHEIVGYSDKCLENIFQLRKQQRTKLKPKYFKCHVQSRHWRQNSVNNYDRTTGKNVEEVQIDKLIRITV